MRLGRVGHCDVDTCPDSLGDVLKFSVYVVFNAPNHLAMKFSKPCELVPLPTHSKWCNRFHRRASKARDICRKYIFRLHAYLVGRQMAEIQKTRDESKLRAHARVLRCMVSVTRVGVLCA